MLDFKKFVGIVRSTIPIVEEEELLNNFPTIIC